MATKKKIPEAGKVEIHQAGAPVAPVQTGNLQEQPQTPQQKAEAASVASAKYYPKWPAIRGMICEFCGISYRQCPHYKAHHEKHGNFVCLCGRTENEQAAKGAALLYVPHRGLFVCDSAGCEKKYYDQYGGFERLLSWHFFRSEVPFYGSLLADPVESTKLE